MNNITVKNLKRISKAAARKAYNNGQKVLIVPCKVNPCNMWGIGHFFNKQDGDGFDYEFDKVVNYYSYYNCSYNELGKYPAYYVEY